MHTQWGGGQRAVAQPFDELDVWPLLAWDWCDRDTLFLMQAKIKISFPLRTVKLLILHSG